MLYWSLLCEKSSRVERLSFGNTKRYGKESYKTDRKMEEEVQKNKKKNKACLWHLLSSSAFSWQSFTTQTAPEKKRKAWSLNHPSPPPLFAFLLPFFLLIALTWKGQNKCSFGMSCPGLPQHAESTTYAWGIGLREELNYISLIFFNSQELPLQVDSRRETWVFQMFWSSEQQPWGQIEQKPPHCLGCWVTFGQQKH